MVYYTWKRAFSKTYFYLFFTMKHLCFLGQKNIFKVHNIVILILSVKINVF